VAVIRRRECARCGCKIVAGNLCGFDCPLDNRDHGDETVVVEYVPASQLAGAVDERDEAIELLRMAAHRLAPLAPYDSIRDFLDRERKSLTARSVLSELVRLKDGPRDEAYRVAKDAAWQRARDVLARTSA
jgi:hypothetical protein